MHAPKIPKTSSTTFDAPIPQTANLQALHLQKREKARSFGNCSPVMKNSFGLASSRVLETKKAELAAQQQGKGTKNVKAQSQPTDALSGSGQSLSPALMAKYEGLLGGNVSLGGVRVHQGAGVDAALAASGLQGLTDGKNVAVSSRADRGTLEHELGHVAQQQQSGFNLNEGTRGTYEVDADRIAERLVSGRVVENFTSSTVQPLPEAQAKESFVQAKCEKCDAETQQLTDKENVTKDVAKSSSEASEAYEALQNLRRIYDDIAASEVDIQMRWPDPITMGECFKKHGAEMLFNLGTAIAMCIAVREGLAYPIFCAIELGRVVESWTKYINCVRKHPNYSNLSENHLNLLETIQRNLNIISQYINED